MGLAQKCFNAHAHMFAMPPPLRLASGQRPRSFELIKTRTWCLSSTLSRARVFVKMK